MRILILNAGITQLITAITCIRSKDLYFGLEIDLYISELAVEKSQEPEFIRHIIRLTKLLNIKNIFFKKDIGKRLELNYFKKNIIFTPTTWQSEYKEIIKMSDLNKIYIYGDGVGIQIPKWYFDNFKLKRLRFFIHNLIESLKFRNNIKFSISKTTINNKPILGEVKIIERFSYVNTLLEIIQMASINDSDIFEDTTDFILGVNLYESKRISLDNEISMIEEYIENECEGNKIIYKPHPRDSILKIDRISKINIIDKKIIVLDDKRFSQYLPFELILFMLIRSEKIIPNFTIHSFSTAFLSLRFLGYESLKFGFKSELIKKYFNKEFINSRINHEIDLLKYSGNIS